MAPRADFFKDLLKKSPWRRLRRRPQGASRPGEGDFMCFLTNLSSPMHGVYVTGPPAHLSLHICGKGSS